MSFTETIMGERLRRQKPFLKSVLAEADKQRRKQMLRVANADQINAVSELVMNTLRGNVPQSRNTVRILKPNRDQLREASQRRQSLKKRREILMDQSGGEVWSELNRCFKRMCDGRLS